jgi:biopolymer transport protein ExbD
MALTLEGSGRPGRKAVDSIVNMVPFIDLLVCCIAFLIITAVWTQLERLDLRQEGGVIGRTDSSVAAPVLRLRMGEQGFTIVDEVGARVTVPRSEGRFDLARLGRELGTLRRIAAPSTRVVLTPDDGQRYDDIVAVLDATLAARFQVVDFGD